MVTNLMQLNKKRNIMSINKCIGVLLAATLVLTGCGIRDNTVITDTSGTQQRSDIEAEEASLKISDNDNTASENAVTSYNADQKNMTSKECSAVSNSSAATSKEEMLSGNGYIVAIDPGHQAPDVDMSAKEPNAPGSTVMKAKATSGTQGRYTGVGEYELNLTIALKLRSALEACGYEVVLTRENNETGISNSERAQLANESGANVMIRIHANGAESSSASGAMALIGSADNKYVGDLYDESNRLASDVLNAYCASTGMKNGEVQTSDTMTGINWSKIPVMILEMGFMTNETDDRNMENSDYQDRMVKGIVDGLNVYFGVSNSNNDDITDEILEYIASKGQNNGTISVYAKRLGSENGTASVVNEKKMQAASLIKLFIAGCVYENIDDVLN